MDDPARPRFSTVVVPDDNAPASVPSSTQPSGGWAPPAPVQPAQIPNPPFPQAGANISSSITPDQLSAPATSTQVPQTTSVPPAVQMPPLGQTPPQMPVMHGGNSGHHMRRLAFLIPAIVLIVTFVAVGFYFSQKGSVVSPEKTPEPTQAPELPSATPFATPKPVPQSYSSGTLSFHYPSDLSLVECGDDIYLSTAEIEDIPVFCDGEEKDGVAISIEKSSRDFGKLDGDLDSAQKAEVSGIEAIREHYLIDDKKVQTIIFEFDENFFRLTLFVDAYEAEFSTLVSGMKLYEADPTKNWVTYTNTLNKYSFKYPDDWALGDLLADEKAELLEQIDLAPEDVGANQSLSLLVQSNLDNSALTASEVISSTRNLAAWKSTPSVSARSLSGASGQIIEGSQEGKWVTYFVVWYKQSVIQMEWTDTPNRLGQETFNNLLSTFKFTN